MERKTTQVIEAAKSLLKSYGYFVHQLWHVDDVHFICEQRELPRIGDDEAMEVLEVASKQFDGEQGISWPQLEKALSAYLQEKTSRQQVCESESQA